MTFERDEQLFRFETDVVTYVAPPEPEPEPEP